MCKDLKDVKEDSWAAATYTAHLYRFISMKAYEIPLISTRYPILQKSAQAVVIDDENFL